MAPELWGCLRKLELAAQRARPAFKLPAPYATRPGITPSRSNPAALNRAAPDICSTPVNRAACGRSALGIDGGGTAAGRTAGAGIAAAAQGDTALPRGNGSTAGDRRAACDCSPAVVDASASNSAGAASSIDNLGGHGGRFNDAHWGPWCRCNCRSSHREYRGGCQ